MLPLASLLIIYFVFLAIFAIFVLINIYHLVASAALTSVSFTVTFFVIAAGILTIYGAWALIQGVDFQQPLFNPGSISDTFHPNQF